MRGWQDEGVGNRLGEQTYLESVSKERKMHLQLKGEVTLTLPSPLTPPFTLALHLRRPLGTWWNAWIPTEAHALPFFLCQYSQRESFLCHSSQKENLPLVPLDEEMNFGQES